MGARGETQQLKVSAGNGSIWIFHTTHHAGTFLRITAEENGWWWDNSAREVLNKNAPSGPHTPPSGLHACSIKEEELGREDHKFFFDTVCGEDGMYGVTNLADSFPC